MSYKSTYHAIIQGDEEEFYSNVDEADLEATSESGKNLLSTAATVGEDEMAAALINRGIDIHLKNEEGKTPLHLALEHENNDVAKLLVENGSDPNIRDTYGNTPLMRAVFKGNVEMVKLLVGHGADPTVENEGGNTHLISPRSTVYRNSLRLSKGNKITINLGQPMTNS
ncbi:ankyrin repeat-containing protein [Halovivax asiaticus JCM 14624]|uniref:Ankyrin repeat-containing protein n=1 Tax=Halovivax asiaticus JCM 14624 TaxID=1227490 RepID=M0BXC4_9EURY|nr:ankyrin repeat domain-containing protein [Halovivax asiaticus]ELZ14324.1 ankyrin repeat-containing protein [Halovivax asiaticus JCM 14624]